MFYLLYIQRGAQDATAAVINLDGYATCQLVQRALNWQRIGQGEHDHYEIATRTGPDTFKNASGVEFTARRSPYTEAAWNRFLATWKA